MEGLPSLDYINIIAHEQEFVKRKFEKIEKKICGRPGAPLPPSYWNGSCRLGGRG